jgi:hypothetical protein
LRHGDNAIRVLPNKVQASPDIFISSDDDALCPMKAKDFLSETSAPVLALGQISYARSQQCVWRIKGRLLIWDAIPKGSLARTLRRNSRMFQ